MKFYKNELHNRIIQVAPGYEICPRCKGKGYHDEYDQEDHPHYGVLECSLCDGDGQIDWVENVFNQNWEEGDKQFIQEMEEEDLYEDFSQELLDWERSSFDIDLDYQLGEDDD